MKLLIVNEKLDINDAVLAPFHHWVAALAGQCKSVTVISLGVGEYDLPANVRVFSLNKERLAAGCLAAKKKIFYLYNFYKYIWQERGNYDTVLVLMNPIYIVLGGIFWRLAGKKIGLWYAHGHIPWQLRIAEKLTHIIFTSTKSGCRLRSKKIKVVGQGIDINKFKIQNSKFKIQNSKFKIQNSKFKIQNSKTETKENKFKIITVGRISPVKDYETLIKAVKILASQGMNLAVAIVGGPGTPAQAEYLARLKKMVAAGGLAGVVRFVGAVPNKEIGAYLAAADLFVNTSRTGSLDKAILEAMACGLPILTNNEALREVLGRWQEQLMFAPGDAAALAQKIKEVASWRSEERQEIGRALREIVQKNHSLAGLAEKIITVLAG